MSESPDNVVYLNTWRKRVGELNDSHKASIQHKTNGAVFTEMLEILEEYGIDIHNIPADEFMRMVSLTEELAEVLIRVVEYHKGRRPE